MFYQCLYTFFFLFLFDTLIPYEKKSRLVFGTLCTMEKGVSKKALMCQN